MKLGFIGCGNMAQAMITGILTQKVVSPQELIVSNPREEKTAKLKDEKTARRWESSWMENMQ